MKEFEKYDTKFDDIQKRIESTDSRITYIEKCTEDSEKNWLTLASKALKNASEEFKTIQSATKQLTNKYVQLKNDFSKMKENIGCLKSSIESVIRLEGEWNYTKLRVESVVKDQKDIILSITNNSQNVASIQANLRLMEEQIKRCKLSLDEISIRITDDVIQTMKTNIDSIHEKQKVTLAIFKDQVNKVKSEVHDFVHRTQNIEDHVNNVKSEVQAVVYRTKNIENRVKRNEKEQKENKEEITKLHTDIDNLNTSFFKDHKELNELAEIINYRQKALVNDVINVKEKIPNIDNILMTLEELLAVCNFKKMLNSLNF